MGTYPGPQMDDIEAFLLASGTMSAKAKINMDMEIVEIPAWKPNLQTSLQSKVGLFSPLCLPAVDLARARMYLLVAVVACDVETRLPVTLRLNSDCRSVHQGISISFERPGNSSFTPNSRLRRNREPFLRLPAQHHLMASCTETKVLPRPSHLNHQRR